MVFASYGTIPDKLHLGLKWSDVGWRQEEMDARFANGRTNCHAHVYGLFGLGHAIPSQSGVRPFPILSQALRPDGEQARSDHHIANQANIQESPGL